MKAAAKLESKERERGIAKQRDDEKRRRAEQKEKKRAADLENDIKVQRWEKEKKQALEDMREKSREVQQKVSNLPLCLIECLSIFLARP